ncbi:LIM domain-containing protein [Nocardia sp. NPDC050630]|uniref:LIM domain-containing protein n=1 Tax=Nocardia sp. NPDC050630 TaxID=3364321 RepID=UPI00379B28F1
MPTLAPQVIADPIGVVIELVTRHDNSLDISVVTGIVEAVSGGRAKRRRLAQALLDRPQVLADGRSPGPRVVADLLARLKRAGAVTISAPVCAKCGKPVGRSLQRAGQDWYCHNCFAPRYAQPCAGCGQHRHVHSRDREGRPRCKNCPPEPDRDPVDVVIATVASIDPALPVDTVAAAVKAVVPKPGQRWPLAWAVESRPELFLGAGAEAPVPAVLRLIDRLCDAGSAIIAHPACPGCGRTIHLHRPISGKWLCRTCTARSRAQQCARCGVIREAATRDEHGRPLCPGCLIQDPINHETCIDCGRPRPVSIRTAAGPLCGACVPDVTAECSICGRNATCTISAATGRPWCRICKSRWARCSGCGERRPVRGGTVDAPLCAACTRDEPGFWRSCPNCGEPGRILATVCGRCRLDHRLHELLGDEHGQIHPHLQPLYQALIRVERLPTVETWLRRSAAPAILRALQANGQKLSHTSLDELPPSKTLEHFRSVLVATGTLPQRDEHMAWLERWVYTVIADRVDPDERNLLHRYAIWHVIRRLRHRTHGRTVTRGQAAAAQATIKAAGALLDWLGDRDLTLASATQPDLDDWLTTQHVNAGNFVRWARRNKLTCLDYTAQRWRGPVSCIDTETRWTQARRLLHDDTIRSEDRVAGLLVLLYAQHATTISRLTVEDVHIADDRTQLRLGDEPITLPEPLAGLIRQLTETRRGHAAIAEPDTVTWLFPGGRPGRPLSAERLIERLHDLGIRPSEARNTALFQLATELPAAILARMLGIHISVAANWQQVSSGDWMSYAAQISRRGK